MKWYYKILGGHTHVRVFMNGGKCGDLCFRNEEFKKVMFDLAGANPANAAVTFIPEDPATYEEAADL